jgi:nitrogenase subunit NifH
MCPEGAISETIRVIGSIERSASHTHGIELYQGILNIGEPMASPIIRSLKEHIDDSRTVIIGKLPLSEITTKAMLEGRTVIECKDDIFTGTVQDIWHRVHSKLVSQ